MARSARQLKLIDIINNNNVETQSELTERLIESGFAATQATVSRDIKELGVTKVMTPSRRYKYVYEHEEKIMVNKFNNLFKESVMSIKSSVNIIVVKTIIGSANSAAAFIDNLDINEIIGTIAGDDTIMLVMDKEESVDGVKKQLASYLYGLS